MAEEEKKQEVTADMMAQRLLGKEVEFPKEEEPKPEEEPKEGEPTPEEEPPADPKPEEEEPPADPKPEEEPPADPPKEEENPYDNLDLSKLPEGKALELINTKFSSNFESIDKAVEFFGKQQVAVGANEVITKLTEKLKEKSNILAHFPNENAYRVAQLAKEKFQGKEAILSRVIGSDFSQLSDLDAIRLAQELKRPPGSKVDGLKFQLAKMGLRDLDVAEFDEWEEMDKQLVYGLAEEARTELAQLGKDIEIPSSEGVDDFVSELQRGAAEAKETQDKQIEAIKPIAESMIDATKSIKPVDGDDFEYSIELDKEARETLLDYLTFEALEGKYDLKSDADVKRLQGMLNAEIMATEYSKAFAAYGKYREDKTWEAAQKKYENAEPLNEETPPANPEKKVQTDEDAAQKLLQRGR